MYNENVIVRKNFSIKAKTIMAFIAIVGAVALPQIAHLGGALIGVDNAIGTTLLPMHFAVILVGLLAGGYAGALAGVMAPLVSHWLTAMPTAQMLPIMMVELGAYGLVAGMLSKVEMNNSSKSVSGSVWLTSKCWRISPKQRILHLNISCSSEKAVSGCKFFLSLSQPSFTLFLHVEKQNHFSYILNPTFSLLVSNFGNSCIMHSSLVGDLNVVFVASAYLGLTNSGISPFVFFNVSILLK